MSRLDEISSAPCLKAIVSTASNLTRKHDQDPVKIACESAAEVCKERCKRVKGNAREVNFQIIASREKLSFTLEVAYLVNKFAGLLREIRQGDNSLHICNACDAQINKFQKNLEKPTIKNLQPSLQTIPTKDTFSFANFLKNLLFFQLPLPSAGKSQKNRDKVWHFED